MLFRSLCLASGAASPSLRTFTLIHNLEDQANRTLHAIDELLIFPRPKVRSLQIGFNNAPKLLDIAVLRAHGKSLERLLINVVGNDRSSSTSTRKGPSTCL